MADNLEIINCPACGKKMQKVFMPEAGINLDVCVDGCGGIYFDNREFNKFDEQNEDITPLTELFKDKEFDSVDTSQTRICPVCGMKMVKNFASAQHRVEIDTCYGCGGVFLDNGELQEIRSQYPTEQARAEDVIKELYGAAGKELAIFDEKNKKLHDRWGAKVASTYVKFGTKLFRGY